VFGILVLKCGDEKLKIVHNGFSDHKIVKLAEATTAEEKAVAELQSFLETMSGVKIPIITDDASVEDFEIIIGRNAPLQRKNVQINFDELGVVGFLIRHGFLLTMSLSINIEKIKSINSERKRIC
jgi:hypothetical protein